MSLFNVKSATAAAVVALAALSGAEAQTFPNCGTSVRKAWEDLSCDERSDYLAAVQALKASGRYDDYVTMHFDNNVLAHGTDTFLPWHRWFLWVFEKDLQDVSQSCVTVPYWNWEATYTQELQQAPFASGPDSAYTCAGVWANPNNAWACTDTRFNTDVFGNTADQMCCGCGGGDRSGATCVDLGSGPAQQQNVFQPNSHIFRADAFGTITQAGSQQCVPNGVAQGWMTAQSEGATCLLRSFEPGQEPPHDEADMLDRIVNNPLYINFRPVLEFGPHGAPHIWIGTNMANHYSPDDPLFWLHHCNVDRLWALWQDYHDHDLVSNANAGTAQYAGNADRNNPNPIDSSMPFVNPGVLDFTAPGRTTTPTPRDMHQSFGGMVSVTYGADQLARTIATQYNVNANWVEPAAEDNSASLNTDGSCQAASDACDLNNPCLNGACVDVGGVATCNCANSGFDGEFCQNNIDDCFAGACNSGSCDDAVNGFTCDCSNTGFTGANCEINIDDCAGVDCGPNGTCQDGVNSFVCACDSGFTGNFCETNIDNCPANACSNIGVCVDGVNSYTCDCSGTGFTGSECEINIDDCTANSCANNGVCQDGINSFSCDCTGTGFTGATCESNIDDCFANACSNGGVCVDGVNSYSCDCDGTGFTGAACTTPVDECATIPCQNGGACTDGVNSFTCDCTGTGFDGATCENNIDDCVGVDCGANGVCNDLVNGFECACPIGFEGANCEINIDDCAGVDCGPNGTCQDGVNSFVCACDSGFTGNFCETNVDNCPANACSNIGVCVDGVNSYTCDCTGTGFTGSECEINIDDCTANSCANGGVCQDMVNSFSCDCTGTGFEGPTCAVEVVTGPTEFTRTTAEGEQAMHNAAINLYNTQFSCGSVTFSQYPNQDGSNCQQIFDFWQYCRGTISGSTVTPSGNANHPLCIQWSGTVTQLANDFDLTILSQPARHHVLSRGNAGRRLEDSGNSTLILPVEDKFMAAAPQFRSKFLRRDFAHFLEDYPGLTFAQYLKLIADAECTVKMTHELGDATLAWIEMMGMSDRADLWRC